MVEYCSSGEDVLNNFDNFFCKKETISFKRYYFHLITFEKEIRIAYVHQNRNSFDGKCEP